MSGVLSLEELARFAAREAKAIKQAADGYVTPELFSPRDFLWYLATPYTHPSQEERAKRAELATRMTANLLCGGLNVYSPIAAHHPTSDFMLSHEAPHHRVWMDICYGLLDRCDGVIVSTMDDWWESKGVQLEIKRWKRERGLKRLLYASPILDGQPWTPQFAWKPDQVGAL